MKCSQLLAVEHRQALARVEDEGNAGGRELRGVLDHRLAAVRRDDPERRCRAASAT